MSIAEKIRELLDEDAWLGGSVYVATAGQAAPYVVIWPGDSDPAETRAHGPVLLSDTSLVVHAVGETIDQAQQWFQRVKARLTPAHDLVLVEGYALRRGRTAGPIRDTDANPQLWSFAMEIDVLAKE